MKRKEGFTLLELILVIIITGVLVSLALPAVFQAVTRAHLMEAYRGISLIRQGMEWCYARNNESYIGCELNTSRLENTLDVQDPGLSAGAKFYFLVYSQVDNAQWEGYSIVAFDLELWDGENSIDNVEYQFTNRKDSTVGDRVYWRANGKYYEYVETSN